MTRRRPKTPAPQGGWVIRELSQISGVSVRTLRSYVNQKILRPLERRGTQTRYPRSEVIRLLGALRLKAQTRANWAETKQRLDTVRAADLERWVEQGLAPAVAVELGFAQLSGANASDPDATSERAAESALTTWQRTELLPGLELCLSPHASAAVQRAAQQIIEDHAPRP